jgi:hypothetical protein
MSVINLKYRFINNFNFVMIYDVNFPEKLKRLIFFIIHYLELSIFNASAKGEYYFI